MNFSYPIDVFMPDIFVCVCGVCVQCSSVHIFVCSIYVIIMVVQYIVARRQH